MDSSRLRTSPILAVTWTLLILVACWIPARGLPIPETPNSRFHIPHLDKLIHFTLFAGFGFLWMRTKWGRSRPLLLLLAGIILAAVSELGQMHPLVRRDANLEDWLADFTGLCVVVAAITVLRRGRSPSVDAVS